MPAAVRETRNPQSTSAHQSRAVVQLYLVTPLRLPETTVRIGGDADCGGGGNSFAEIRQTFPKRCWLLWTGVRNASVFAVAASSSIKRIFKPSTPSIDSSATGHIFLCLRPGSPQSLPKIFAGISRGQPPKPIDLQARDPELVGARPAAFHQRAVIFHEAAELGTHVETSPLHARPNLPRLQVHRLHLGSGDFWQRIAQAVVEANLIIGPWRARQPGLLVRVKVGQDLAGTVVKRDERTGAWPLICSDVSCAVITQAKRSKSGSRS
jgi:hypothetical protein